jgi:hypothetical protein
MPYHLFAVTILLAMLLLATTAGAAPPQPVKFMSAKPLFVKLAMGGEGAPVMGLAFDESQGAGKGYDTVYADTNADAIFESAEKFPAQKGTGPLTFMVALPAPLFPAKIADANVEKTGELRVTLYSLGNLNPSVMLALNLRLKRGEETWNYSMTSSGGTLNTDLNKAPVLHAGPVEIVPTVRPGARCGIAARLQAGDFSFSCSGPSGSSSNITVLVKNQAGQAVHEESVPLGRLGFG